MALNLFINSMALYLIALGSIGSSSIFVTSQKTSCGYFHGLKLNGLEIFLDTESLSYYRFWDYGGIGGRSSLESPSMENHIRINLDEKGKRISSTSSESEGRKIFFETKSLAEIYIEQGHISTALEIYRRMQKRDPSDQQIKDRISKLEVHLSQRRGTKIKELDK